RDPASHHTPQENEKVRRRKAATGADCSHLRHAGTSFPITPPLSLMWKRLTNPAYHTIQLGGAWPLAPQNKTRISFLALLQIINVFLW
ncbi:MAG: hypothetical protein OEZ52_12515, partial [Candidatus Aminicenantes bacterium]|nr:hypothetical protein [Candidatus Aminicenantes bacterium]